MPDARLRLLLIPRAELPEILERAGAAALADALEVVTEPVPDLAAELAAAQVGAWPFLFDYTTSPPAMAVAEAMTVGLPVVSTDVACVRAAVRDECDGLFVPAGDATPSPASWSLLTDRPSGPASPSRPGLGAHPPGLGPRRRGHEAAYAAAGAAAPRQLTPVLDQPGGQQPESASNESTDAGSSQRQGA